MKNIIKWGEPLIQTVISVLLLFLMISSGLLPMKYLGVAIALILLLLAITFLTSRSKSTAARSIGAVLAIIFCIVLIFSAVYLNQIMNTLQQISGTDIQLDSIAVILADNDPASSIEETSGYSFGVYEGTDEKYVQETIAEIQNLNGDKELDMHSYDSASELAQALLDGEVQAGICNKAYLAILDDAFTDFSTQTKVVYEKEFETDTRTVIKEAEGKDTEIAKKINLTEDPFTVLISGIDVSGPITTTSRSDVNILMTVNPKTHQILLTTTPRDYYVYIPGVSGDQRDKLTHAGVYGIRMSMKTLENLYDIEIHDYIRINFDSLVQLVDVLGGVDVNSEVEFDSGDNHFVKGINHLNGEQALAFSRTRYAFADGDNQRGRNQMLVLTGIIEKLQSPALLKNPSGVLDVIGRSMQTSISTSQITDVIAWQLNNPQGWEINRQSVTGTNDSQQTFSMPGTVLSVMWPDEEGVKKAAENINEMMKE